MREIFSPSRWMVRFIRVYQQLLSPFLGKNCRFHPTCSAYAVQAIELHGAVKGPLMSIKRIGRCHPFTAGGLDPVPGSNE